MQDPAKKGYTFGHLSLTRSLALDVPSGVAIVRDHQNRGALEKEIWVLFEGTSLFG